MKVLFVTSECYPFAKVGGLGDVAGALPKAMSKLGVEVTHNRVRKERMGHIALSAPIVHTWYSHGIPNRLALILDIPKKKLESVIYFARYIVTDVDKDKQKKVKKDKTQYNNQLFLLIINTLYHL